MIYKTIPQRCLALKNEKDEEVFESECEICHMSDDEVKIKFQDDFDDPCLSAFKCGFNRREYILCPDCIPYNEICSVKEWWERDGNSNYNFDEECWLGEEDHCCEYCGWKDGADEDNLYVHPFGYVKLCNDCGKGQCVGTCEHTECLICCEIV